MGYTTNFDGIFLFNKQIDPEFHEELEKFSKTRHGGNTHNDPNYPGFYCQWVPNRDGSGLIWDGGEKFYEYIPWLKWLIENKFKPNNVVLNGKMFWRGEDDDDLGTIEVKDNKIFVTKGQVIYDKSETVEYT